MPTPLPEQLLDLRAAFHVMKDIIGLAAHKQVNEAFYALQPTAEIAYDTKENYFVAAALANCLAESGCNKRHHAYTADDILKNVQDRCGRDKPADAPLDPALQHVHVTPAQLADFQTRWPPRDPTQSETPYYRPHWAR